METNKTHKYIEVGKKVHKNTYMTYGIVFKEGQSSVIILEIIFAQNFISNVSRNVL